MRCPHCATQVVVPPNCWTCGTSVTAEAVQSALRDLEPTRFPKAAVVSERLPDLMLPDPSGPLPPLARLPVPCPVCGVELGTDATCTGCGARREPRREVVPEAPAKVCAHCGMPVHSTTRQLCLGCGNRIDA